MQAAAGKQQRIKAPAKEVLEEQSSRGHKEYSAGNLIEHHILDFLKIPRISLAPGASRQVQIPTRLGRVGIWARHQ